MKRPSRKTVLRILAGMGVVAVACMVVLAVYVARLDRIVTAQFEGRRWTLPAQVYAQPLDLYAGQTLSANGLEQELQRLGYQQAPEATTPGSYRRRGNRIEFTSRHAQFWDETREPVRLSITAQGNSLARIEDGQGSEVPVFRLDPLLIGSIFPIHGEDRVVLTPEEVPPVLPAALKVVEDRKFDSHFGVDPLGILRALWANFRAGRIEQGGSTLTQQLVKSYFLDSRQTIARKIEEAFMAMILEYRFEKADLMTAYINEIHLGQDGQRAIHGFGLASQFYFGKPLAELQLQEVALLVAVARGPSFYNPRRWPDRARDRRNLVLQLLGEHQVISPEVATAAAERPLGITGESSASSSYFPAFLDFVRRTLRRDYREEDLTETGLKIYTTLDPSIQTRAEAALTQELQRLDKARKQPRAESLEGAVVVTAPQSGDVVAMVGGRRVNFEGLNRALDAKRSIGSLVKPVIYLAAVESGRFNAASIVEDGPVEVKLANGQTWRPQNIGEDFAGSVPLVRALAQSMNLATVRLGLDVGLPVVAREFVNLGLEHEPQQVPALLLGAIDLSPLEVATLYNSLANGGFRTPLRGVRAVLDASGQPLKAFPLEIVPAADPVAVYQVNRMLVQVMERGTGRAARARLPGSLVVAGKSGTSSDYRDSWFAGFSGTHSAVVWIGYDDNSSTGLTGSGGALSVWSQLMAGLNTNSWDTFLPDSLDHEWIEFRTGYLASPTCSQDVVQVPVPKGTVLPPDPACATAPPARGPVGRIGEALRGIIQR